MPLVYPRRSAATVSPQPLMNMGHRRTSLSIALLFTVLPMCSGQSTRVRHSPFLSPVLQCGPKAQIPEVFKGTGLRGTLEFDAVIDEHGRVKSLRYLSGNPALIRAAIEAAKYYEFSAVYRDGVPAVMRWPLTIDVTEEKSRRDPPRPCRADSTSTK